MTDPLDGEKDERAEVAAGDEKDERAGAAADERAEAGAADDASSCNGDTNLDAVPFSATLVGGHNEATGSDLTFVATLPEDVGGTVTLTLGFGTEDDPGEVVALVQTTYPHTGSILFIPYEETLTYTDVFSLSRTE